ncbi:hypothetical protein D9M71_643440 [compost metagenome]
MVWKAIESITPMMLAICCELSVICCMVSTTRPTTSRPSPAVLDASLASALACRALSAFCFTVAVNCSMLAAVSSSEAACCSVREERSALPPAICWAPTRIELLPSRTLPTILARLSCMSRMAASSWPTSLRERISIGCDRSALARRCRWPAASASGWTITRCRP